MLTKIFILIAFVVITPRVNWEWITEKIYWVVTRKTKNRRPYN